MRDSFEWLETGGGSVWWAALRSKLAIAEARRGQMEAAGEQIAEARRSIAEDDYWGALPGLVALAEGVVYGIRGHWDDAEKAFDEALAVAREYGIPWHEADALHERARMYLARGGEGDRKQALQLLDETAAIYQRLGAKRDLEFVLADKLAAQGIESSDIHTSIDRVAAAVQSEHPDLKPHAAPDGTVTIMFSDIEGSTEKTTRLGDNAWMDVLREHNAIVREQISAHSGFEVKSEGDGFMVAFQSARKALDCAIAIQQALAERNRGVGAQHTAITDAGASTVAGSVTDEAAESTGAAPERASDHDRPPRSARPEKLVGRAADGRSASAEPSVNSQLSSVISPEPIHVRIGLHAGEVIKEGEDFFGRNVILAARVASQARGGEILASAVLRHILSGSDIHWGEKRIAELKGLPGDHEIWSVDWA